MTDNSLDPLSDQNASNVEPPPTEVKPPDMEDVFPDPDPKDAPNDAYDIPPLLVPPDWPHVEPPDLPILPPQGTTPPEPESPLVALGQSGDDVWAAYQASLELMRQQPGYPLPVPWPPEASPRTSPQPIAQPVAAQPAPAGQT